MPWIDTVPYEQSTGRLRQLYDRVKGPGDNVDNIMMMHSLRPHSMEGHMALYKQVLHHGANTVPKAFLETIGVWVSLLNRCAYCVEHHCAGLERLLDDDARSAAIRAALETGAIEAGPFEPREKLALRYAEVLTRGPVLGDRGDGRGDARRRLRRWRDPRDQPSDGLFRLCQPHRPGPRLLDRGRHSRSVAEPVGRSRQLVPQMSAAPGVAARSMVRRACTPPPSPAAHPA